MIPTDVENCIEQLTSEMLKPAKEADKNKCSSLIFTLKGWIENPNTKDVSLGLFDKLDPDLKKGVLIIALGILLQTLNE